MRPVDLLHLPASVGDRVRFGERSGTVSRLKHNPLGKRPLGYYVHFDDVPHKEDKHLEYVDAMRRVGEPLLEAYD